LFTKIVNNKKITSVILFLVIALSSFLPRYLGLSIPTINPDAISYENGAEFYVNNILLGEFVNASKAAKDENPSITPCIFIGLGHLFLEKGTFHTPLNIFKKHTASAIPITFISALTAPLMYLILKKMIRESAAFLSGIILSLSPFHIAESRQIHMDTLLTFFTFIPLLLYLLSYHRKEKMWIKACAGILWGFAILCKPSGWALLITIPIIKIFILLYLKDKEIFNLRSIIGDLIFVISGIAIFFLFYTKLWVDPIGGFLNYLKVNLTTANTGHHSYLLGKYYLSPPFYYYPVIIFTRLSILEIIGIISGLSFFFLKKDNKNITLVNYSNIIWLAIMIIGMTFVKIKLGARYVMPIWPAISIISAFGLLKLSSLVTDACSKKLHLKNNFKTIISTSLIIILLIAFLVVPIINFYPYYELYYNSLVGGPKGATRIDAVGWGEGLRIAANYIEERTNKYRKVFVVGYDYVFNEYCKIDLKEKPFPGEAQYIVIQLNYLQREMVNQDIRQALKNFKLVGIVNLKNVDLVWIFKNKNINI
jgi:4-amino-4-deoxy-L-arabinose transferase-like glycosyltransferase